MSLPNENRGFRRRELTFRLKVPLGYTAETAGVMGGVVIGSGVLFAICLGVSRFEPF